MADGQQGVEETCTYEACERRVSEAERCYWHREVDGKCPEEDLELDDGFPTDLRGAYLKEAELSGANLRGLFFSDRTLADLAEACLESADLTDASLGGADLTGASLNNADLTNANLRLVNLTDANLQNASLTNAELPRATLVHANLGNSDLTNVNLRRSDLNSADLSGEGINDGASLVGANLRQTNLTNADLSGDIVSDAVDLSDASLSNANITEADLQGTNLSGVDLQRSNLINTNLKNANLTKTMLLHADVTGANLENTDLSDTNLRHATFDHVTLYDTDLSDVEIDEGTTARPPSGHERRADQDATPDRLPEPIATRLRLFTRSNSDPDDLQRAEQQYRRIERLYRENDLRPNWLSELEIQEKHARRKRALAESDYTGWLRRAFSRWVLGYGLLVKPILGVMLAVILVSTLLYPLSGFADGTLAPGPEAGTVAYDSPLLSWETVETLGRSLYFSTITFSTLGYGDLSPTGWARGLATVESFLGAVLMAYLVSVLSRRAIR